MRTDTQSGFTLPELLIAMTIMLLISGAAVSALLKMTSTQATVWNRTQMHSGIRGATEVMQQEVGQAGRIALPAPVRLNGTVAVNLSPQTVNVSSSAGMFVGEKLTIDVGDAQETVTLTDVGTSPSSITAIFTKAHNSQAPVAVYGGFHAGIVPPSTTNGSDGSVLKLFGDINADGSMVYIEYKCDTDAGNLYRNMMAWNAGAKPALGPSMILLSNIAINPNGTPCFTYQTATVNSVTYVTDVAITLTVETQLVDTVTKRKQQETKALLNVSPRNVFSAWQLASLGIADRIQPTPTNITNVLLPPITP